MAIISALSSGFSKTPASIGPSRPANNIVKYSGNYGATVTEQTVDVLPTDAYRSIVMSVTASAWGVASVTIKIYPCDSLGNTIGTNPFFSITVAANGTTTVILAEMGGSTSAATYPPTVVQSSGSFIGPFGNFVKITETSTFTSGTNTVVTELDCKG
jgi:hypothetical protein